MFTYSDCYICFVLGFLFHCVVMCIVCMKICTVLLSHGDNSIGVNKYIVSHHSVVFIATGYGLDGPGIESRWGRDFPHLFNPALGPTQPSVQWVPCYYRGKKEAGA